jgi:hypothetical protein
MRTKPKIRSRIGGLMFLITIVCVFFIAIVTTLSNLLIFSESLFNSQRLVGSFLGFVFGLILIPGPNLLKFRTFIHELKHAIVVVLTGNKLKDFKVESGTGHVTFDLYENKISFAPAITLAPYYFPLFSCPLLCLAIFIGDSRPMLLPVMLGFALAIDIITGIEEVHPNQSDLQRIIGGFFIAVSFIVGVLFAWINICLLWILSEKSGFIYSFRLYSIFLSEILGLN